MLMEFGLQPFHMLLVVLEAAGGDCADQSRT